MLFVEDDTDDSGLPFLKGYLDYLIINDNIYIDTV